MDVRFIPAARIGLANLADLFTRSFAEYFYPGVTTPELLAKRVRVESIDLLRSPVLLVEGAPAGIALLARRGERAWCGGFGVVLEQRGRGLAHALAAEMLAQARQLGAQRLMLEVLTRNQRALRVYERAGMRRARNLLVLSWRPDPDGPPLPPAPPYPVEQADPERLVLDHFAALHPARPAWQRDAASLLAQEGLRGLAMPGGGQVQAYAIVSGDESGLRIFDFAARDAGWANHLLGALQTQATSLLSINEPADSPLTPAFTRAGFITVDEQHELELVL